MVTCVGKSTYTNTYIYTYKYTYTYIYTSIHLQTYVYIQTYIHIYIHIYAFKLSHTHRHTLTLTLKHTLTLTLKHTSALKHTYTYTYRVLTRMEAEGSLTLLLCVKRIFTPKVAARVADVLRDVCADWTRFTTADPIEMHDAEEFVCDEDWLEQDESGWDLLVSDHYNSFQPDCNRW
jgi:hypothetical protein